MTIVPVHVVNFWPNFATDTHWESLIGGLQHAFARKGYQLQPHTKGAFPRHGIVIASVFGPIEAIEEFKDNFVILFTGENNSNGYYVYDDIKRVEKSVNVYLNFDTEDTGIKMRFPLWMVRHDFYKKQDSQAYKFVQQNMNVPYQEVPFEKREGLTMVATSDIGGLRMALLEEFKRSGIHVTCPSRVGKNSPAIGPTRDAKNKYLKQFLFNICPENTFRHGYTTEKLVDAVMAGCIPIYYGDDVTKEKFFNPNRVIVPKHARHKKYADAIDSVLQSPEELRTLYHKPLFSTEAINTIDSYLSKLDTIADMYKAHNQNHRDLKH